MPVALWRTPASFQHVGEAVKRKRGAIPPKKITMRHGRLMDCLNKNDDYFKKRIEINLKYLQLKYMSKQDFRIYIFRGGLGKYFGTGKY